MEILESEKKKRGQQKGHTGNPFGRPKKGECMTEILSAIGDLCDIKVKDELISRKKAIAQRLWSMALSGDLPSIKYIYDRIDGSPKQSVAMDMTTELPDDFFEIRHIRSSDIIIPDVAT